MKLSKTIALLLSCTLLLLTAGCGASPVSYTHLTLPTT